MGAGAHRDFGEFNSVYRHLDGTLRRGTVYVLHFEWNVLDNRPLDAQEHYIGWTTDLEKRLRKHVTLESGSLHTMMAIYMEGLRFVLGASFPDMTVLDEKRLQKDDGSKHCELCQLWKGGKREEAQALAATRFEQVIPHVDYVRGASASIIRSIWINDLLEPKWFPPY